MGSIGNRLSFVAFFLAVSSASLAEIDPVAELDRKLAAGEAHLQFDSNWGYLPSLLRELDIPVSSQLLVFSKTSAQFRLITSRTPRAIYFNEDTYVGWVPSAPEIEVSTATAAGGAAFYTLLQREAFPPRFVPDNGSCLQCHESHRTLGVPGHLTRSVYPAPDGLPHFRHGTLNVDHTTNVSERWGGWFVTGRVGVAHRGNAIGQDNQFDAFASGSLSQPPYSFFDATKYLTPHSDVIAHLVLAHQTRVHNAIARAAIEARAAMAYQEEMERLFGETSESLRASVRRRIERPAEALVEDLLMAGEAPLRGVSGGGSGFSEEFQRRGARDASGRSLRDLELGSRLFRYPCSYLINSAAFARLPVRVRNYVRRRMTEVLSGRDTSPVFQHLDADDRQALSELLSNQLSLE